jgi:hypothetical protein
LAGKIPAFLHSLKRKRIRNEKTSSFPFPPFVLKKEDEKGRGEEYTVLCFVF